MSKSVIQRKLDFAEIERDRFERLFEAEKEARQTDREIFEQEIKRLKEASETDVRHITQVSNENRDLASKLRTMERTLDNYIRGQN